MAGKRTLHTQVPGLIIKRSRTPLLQHTRVSPLPPRVRLLGRPGPAPAPPAAPCSPSGAPLRLATCCSGGRGRDECI